MRKNHRHDGLACGFIELAGRSSASKSLGCVRGRARFYALRLATRKFVGQDTFAENRAADRRERFAHGGSLGRCARTSGRLHVLRDRERRNERSELMDHPNREGVECFARPDTGPAMKLPRSGYRARHEVEQVDLAAAGGPSRACVPAWRFVNVVARSATTRRAPLAEEAGVGPEPQRTAGVIDNASISEPGSPARFASARRRACGWRRRRPHPLHKIPASSRMKVALGRRIHFGGRLVASSTEGAAGQTQTARPTLAVFPPDNITGQRVTSRPHYLRGEAE